MKTLTFVICLFLALGIAFAQQAAPASEKKEFPKLQSSQQTHNTTFTVISEVRFLDYLISEESAVKLSEDERGQIGVYHYIYTFTNKGEAKIRVGFGNWGFLLSPLMNILQDFSIVLKPGETKRIAFQANTMPQSTSVPDAIMFWYPNEKKWVVGSGGVSSFWIPRWNALIESIPIEIK